MARSDRRRRGRGCRRRRCCSYSPGRGGGISPAVFLLNTRSVGRGSRKGLWVFQRSFQAGIEVSRVVEGVAVLLLHIICIFLRDRSSWIMVKLPIGH